MKNKFSVIFILLAFIFAFGIFFDKYKISTYADENVFSNQSKSSYLIDSESETIIHSHNADKRMPIASMCKIMTLLLCFDAIESDKISLDQQITVSENASSMGGSQVFLEANQNYMISNLIKSIVVASANDACIAMAETIAESEEQFVDLMNEKAKELSMNNTCFINATGLPGAGQYSCAKDVAIMFKELLKHNDYFKFSKIWTDEIEHTKGNPTLITNTNKLIRFYQGCDSGKTGYTAEAGHCLVASAVRNDTRLIAVVISAPDSKTRFSEVSNMFNYGFSNYCSKLVVDSSTPLNVEFELKNGKKDKIEVVAEKSFSVFCKKNEKKCFDIQFHATKQLKAPIKQGDNVGIIEIFENGIKIKEINILSYEDVAKKSYFDNLIDVVNNWSLIWF